MVDIISQGNDASINEDVRLCEPQGCNEMV